MFLTSRELCKLGDFDTLDLFLETFQKIRYHEDLVCLLWTIVFEKIEVRYVIRREKTFEEMLIK